MHKRSRIIVNNRCLVFKKQNGVIRCKSENSQKYYVQFIDSCLVRNGLWKRIKTAFLTLFNSKIIETSVVKYQFSDIEEFNNFILEFNRVYNKNIKQTISKSDKEIKIKINKDSSIVNVDRDRNEQHMNSDIVSNGKQKIDSDEIQYYNASQFLKCGNNWLSVRVALDSLQRAGYKITVANLNQLFDERIINKKEYKDLKTQQQLILSLISILKKDNLYNKILQENKQAEKHAQQFVEQLIQSQQSQSNSYFGL